MNESTKSKTIIARIILSSVAVVCVILGWLEIVPDKIALGAAILFIGAAAIWNCVEAFIEKRTKSAVLNFVMALILIIITVTAFFI